MPCLCLTPMSPSLKSGLISGARQLAPTLTFSPLSQEMASSAQTLTRASRAYQRSYALILQEMPEIFMRHTIRTYSQNPSASCKSQDGVFQPQKESVTAIGTSYRVMNQFKL